MRVEKVASAVTKGVASRVVSAVNPEVASSEERTERLAVVSLVG